MLDITVGTKTREEVVKSCLNDMINEYDKIV